MRVFIVLAAFFTLGSPTALAADTAPTKPFSLAHAFAQLLTPGRMTTSGHSTVSHKLAMDRVLLDDTGKKYCLGKALCSEYCAKRGGGCEIDTVYTQKLDQPARISWILLYAHDNLGPTRRVDLLRVKVDGAELGKFAVNRAGATISIPVNRVGQLITVEPTYDRNAVLLGGERSTISEGAMITDMYVFGHSL
jgi:hypothetical protein